MKKVLVVDDENDFCFFLKKNLEAAGEFDVDFCCDEQSGLAKAKQWHPDIILLDVRMPDMGGGDVATALREDEITKSIPMIFITALAKTYNLKDKEYSKNGELFIAKPVIIKDLVEAINNLTG